MPIDWPNPASPQVRLGRPHRENPSDFRPFILDGHGKIISTFDIPVRLPQITDYRMPQSNLWWGDWGDYYCYRIVDLKSDGQRIVIWTRRDLWVFVQRNAE